MATKNLKVHTFGKSKNPAIVFLHAFPFSSDMWDSQLQVCSEQFFCVAPDLPGFGSSKLPEHAVTFEYYVDSVLDFLKEEKIKNSVWCGLSMGGYLALRMYEKAPEQCRALVLCDTKAAADANEAKIKRWGAIQSLQKDRKEFIEQQWKALAGESSQSKKELKKQFVELIEKTNSEGIAAGLVALATRTDSTALLSQIKVPTLIMVGEEDKVTPLKEAEFLQKSIEGSQLKTISEAGHLSNLEDPKKFNELLLQFVTALRSQAV